MKTSARSKSPRICTFPDQTVFPLTAVLGVWQDMVQVGYYDEDLPQVVWVHRDFVTPPILPLPPSAKEEAAL
jgi:hypothetical protein